MPISQHHLDKIKDLVTGYLEREQLIPTHELYPVVHIELRGTKGVFIKHDGIQEIEVLWHLLKQNPYLLFEKYGGFNIPYHGHKMLTILSGFKTLKDIVIFSPEEFKEHLNKNRLKIGPKTLEIMRTWLKSMNLDLGMQFHDDFDKTNK